MANSNGTIDEIIGEKGFEQVNKISSLLEKLNQEFKDTAFSINVMNSALGNSRNLKDLARDIQGITNSVTQLSKIQTQEAKEQERLSALQQKTLQERLKNEKLLLDIENKKATAAKKAAADIEHEEGSINQMRATIKKLHQEYDAMGAKARDAFGAPLLANIQKTDAALKQLEGTTGRHQRNVGNYGNAVFSLSQVFREMPAFTYSATQGVLALGNNLPILVDEFQRTALASDKVTNKVNGVAGAMKIFGASIFSFVNIFTIVTGLLTIWMGHMEMAKNKAKATKDEVNELNKSLGREVGSIETLNRILKSHTTSYKQKIDAANELLKMQPKILAGYSAEEIAAGKASIAIDKIKNSVLALAHAKHLQTQVDAAVSKQYDLDAEKYQKQFELSELYRQRTTISRRMALMTPGSNAYDIQNQLFIDNNTAIESTKEAIRYIGKDVLAVNTLLESLTNKIAKYKSDVDPKFIAGGAGVAEAKVQADAVKPPKVDTPIWLTLAENWGVGKGEGWKQALEDAYKDMYPRIVEEVERLTTENVLPEQEALLLNALLLGRKSSKLTPEQLKQIEEANRKLKEAIASSSFDIAGSIGTAISAQELQNIDFRERALKNYYDNELRFIEQSGMSQAKKEKAKQKLQAETAAKEKQIERDRITALRKAAIYQKGLDIAQAIANVVLAVTKKGVTTPDAIAAGVLGLAQISRILAAPLPQYAKGRKGGKEEWAVVGEAGQEAIVHNGKVSLTPNQPTVTLLPQGADVIPNHELIKNAAYVHLVKTQQVTSETYGKALLAAFEENTQQTMELKEILRAKNFKVEYKSLESYNEYIRTKIR